MSEQNATRINQVLLAVVTFLAGVILTGVSTLRANVTHDEMADYVQNTSPYVSQRARIDTELLRNYEAVRDNSAAVRDLIRTNTEFVALTKVALAKAGIPIPTGNR